LIFCASCWQCRCSQYCSAIRFSKRFTSLCHFWLGLALGLAPLAAHLAVRGNLWSPWRAWRCAGIWPFEAFSDFAGLTVLFWCAGFDSDLRLPGFRDRQRRSAVAFDAKRIGIRNTLILSAVLHFLAIALLAVSGIYAGMVRGISSPCSP